MSRNDEFQISQFRDMLENSLEDELEKLEHEIRELNMDAKTKIEEVLDLAEKL